MGIYGEPVLANVTSWGSGSDFVAKLTTYQAFDGIVYTAKGSTWDATVFGTTANFTAEGAGLVGVDFSLEAHLLAPQDGYNGLVTFASGDALNITGWDMSISRPLYPVTPLGQQWLKYRPGRVSITGSYEGSLDDTTAPSGPLLTGGWAAATFTVKSGASGKQLAGAINYTQTQGTLKPGANASKSYTYKVSGALTTVGTSTSMLWPADSTGALLSALEIDKALTLTLNTGLTISGAAYWKSIKIMNKGGQAVKVSVEGSYSDTVTGLTR